MGATKLNLKTLVTRRGHASSLRSLAARVGLGIGTVVLAGAVFVLVFRGSILNHYCKGRAERAFARAHPRCTLRIGELHYSLWADRLDATSAALNAPGLTLTTGRITVTGIRWSRFLWDTVDWADVLAKASLEATNIDLAIPRSHYGIRCARLRLSAPDSTLIAERSELRPLAGDEAFFAAHAFRTPRFHVVLPECTVTGLEYEDALQGRAYRARSVHFSRPSFDALLNREQLPEPFVKRPLMPHEALHAIRTPMQVGGVHITNGLLTYRERMVIGADPAVLTFGTVSLSAENISNRGEPAAAILIRGQGDLMNAGTLRVLLSIPISPPDFSLRYSGALSAMDLTRLNAFLEVSEHLRITSGALESASFEIDVTAGQAQGRLRALYTNLGVAVLDKTTGTEEGLDNRVASFLANLLKIRGANAPEASGSMKEGTVNYAQRDKDEFVQFLWFALRTGVLDIIEH